MPAEFKTNAELAENEHRTLGFLAAPELPNELGRLEAYAIVKTLGEGGMGIVFHAQDLQLRRPVAIKVMKPVLASSESGRRRFLREAQAMAAIQHDHIVPIYHIGDHHGIPFLVMPLLEGETLESRLRMLKEQNKITPLAEVLRIGRELSEGLAAAHKHGLMHRDIKPANVWLETYRERVKILDFGLVRTVYDSRSPTSLGAVMGTPGYIAPEQARGLPDTRMRSDLFSLGCVLYHVCTGTKPFQGSNLLSILLATEERQPEPPSAIAPDVPEELSNLVMKLLEKDPDDRYQSAHEVALELEGCSRSLNQTPLPFATPLPLACHSPSSTSVRNPFVWRSGIAEPGAFFNRQREQRIVRDFLHKRQNCQIVGPRRIGKTSFLMHIQHFAVQWEEDIVVAYLDLQLPQCFTLLGWLGRISKQLNWKTVPANLSDLAEQVEKMIAQNKRPVVCLDEFGELSLRPHEFTRDFLSTLRACGQQGLSIVTASDRLLSELTDPTDRVISPFYNTFPVVRLNEFVDKDAIEFVTQQREGVPPFTAKEQAKILTFARRHPLALQVICFRCLEARDTGEPWETTVKGAEEEMRSNLPRW